MTGVQTCALPIYLAVLAARELRLGASTDNLHLRALTVFVQTEVSKTMHGKPGIFDDDEFVGKIAQAMGEKHREIVVELLPLDWIANAAMEMSLLLFAREEKAKQKKVKAKRVGVEEPSVDHLLRTTLFFCDAVDHVVR